MLNQKKCLFFRIQIGFLRYVISDEGTMMTDDKENRVMNGINKILYELKS